MLTLDIFAAATTRQRTPDQHSPGLSRLFAAAVVSRDFREILLREPEAAIADGYLGQTFQLTDREAGVLCSIQAESLTDLAQKVNRALKSGL